MYFLVELGRGRPDARTDAAQVDAAGCRLHGFEVGEVRRPDVMPDSDEEQSLRLMPDEIALVQPGRG